MNKYKKYLIINIFTILISSPVDLIINEFLNGNNKYTKNEIINNINSYKNNQETLILKGLIENNGEIAFNNFYEYFTKSPDGDYAELAAFKIGEYYYARGLYIKAAKWYKKVAYNYPESENLIPSINYYLNSLSVSGNLDSAKYYSKILKEKYPKLNFNTKFYSKDNYDKPYTDEPTKDISQSNRFSVEIGIYEKYNTAIYYKNMLSSEGFLSEIHDIVINNKNIYSVRVGYYKEYQKADNIKKRIYSRLGITNLSVIKVE